jgi:hypothetical protein
LTAASNPKNLAESFLLADPTNVVRNNWKQLAPEKMTRPLLIQSIFDLQ